MQTVVTFKRASVGYDKHPVLRDASFSIKQGEFLLLVGPNGSGKSSLVKTMLGVLPIISGSVKLFGTSTSRFRGWRDIGYAPQSIASFNLLFPATVSELVQMGSYARKAFHGHATKQRLDEVLDLFELQDIRHRPIGELSGGQFQRAILARALIEERKLLVLDEPVTALDPHIRRRMHEELERLNTEEGVTIVYITHDLSEVHECATTLLYVDRKVIFHGSLKDFCLSSDMTGYFGSHAQHHLCHQHHE